MAATLIGILTAIDTLTPLGASLINQLRQGNETDDEVVARARRDVVETRTITAEDMGDQP